MTPELRARLDALLVDPARVADVQPDQVAPLITELVHLLGHLAPRLLASGSSGSSESPPELRVRPDRLLTPEETAGVLGVSVRWLYRHAPTLPFTRRLSRKALRFSEFGLNKYLTARTR